MSRPAWTTVRAFFFFCNAVFAFCAALFIHELGHALFIKAVHGYFPKISMNPLAGGHVSYYADPSTFAQQLWISSGGILLGSVAGVVCAVIGLGLLQTVWAAPVILFGIVSLCINSLMLTAGYFLFPTGDIHRMVDLGFPVWLAVVCGVSGLFAGGYLMLLALPYFGLDRDSTLMEKYIVLGSGVALYGGLVLGVTILLEDAHHLQQRIKYVTTMILVLVVGLHVIEQAAPLLPRTRTSQHQVRGVHLVFSAVLALGAFWLTSR
ncbi:MAG: hypothetical protein KC900_06380 [Candidatus Omnitrophica bacterium]|nr:hypothetical protein [Candidatus Omnitrophota bacterium]